MTPQSLPLPIPLGLPSAPLLRTAHDLTLPANLAALLPPTLSAGLIPRPMPTPLISSGLPFGSNPCPTSYRLDPAALQLLPEVSHDVFEALAEEPIAVSLPPRDPVRGLLKHTCPGARLLRLAGLAGLF